MCAAPFTPAAPAPAPANDLRDEYRKAVERVGVHPVTESANWTAGETVTQPRTISDYLRGLVVPPAKPGGQ